MELSTARDLLKVKSTAAITEEIEKLKTAYETLRNSGAPVNELAVAEQHLREETKKLTEEMQVNTKESDKQAKAAAKAARALQLEKLEDSEAQYKKMAEAARESAREQQQAVGQAISTILTRYKELSSEVNSILKNIADRQRGLTDDLRGISRTGMDSGSAWKDMKGQADEYYAAAQNAADAGNMKDAVMWADKAKSAYMALNQEVKNGDQVLVSASAARKEAMEGTQRAGEFAIAALTAQKDAALNTMQNMDAATGGALSAAVSESDRAIAHAFDTLDKYSGAAHDAFARMRENFSAVWKEGATAANASFGWISQGLAKIQKQIKEVRREAANAESASQQTASGVDADGNTPGGIPHHDYTLQDGGLIGHIIQRLALGGGVRPLNALAGLHLPGFGGGDRRLILGEDGEVMLNRHSVAAGGLRAALAFNAGRFDIVLSELSRRFQSRIGYHLGGLLGYIPALPEIPVQHMATGGAVASPAASAPSRVVEVRFAGGQVQGDERSVEMLLQHLEQSGLSA